MFQNTTLNGKNKVKMQKVKKKTSLIFSLLAGSMPIGNGIVGANVWVESGALYLYVGSQNAWDENGDLLKLIKLALTFDPPLSSTSFSQTLDLSHASVNITTSEISIVCWIDANKNILHLDVSSSVQLSLTAKLQVWRNESIPTYKDWDEMFCKSRTIYPDVVVGDSPLFSNALVWYHRNREPNIFQDSLEAQGLKGVKVEDPLVNRTFGGLLEVGYNIFGFSEAF